MKSTANKEKDGQEKSLIGPNQVKNDDKLISMITKSESVYYLVFILNMGNLNKKKHVLIIYLSYSIDQIEAYVSDQRSYNFIAQVFMYIAKEDSKEE